MIFKKIIFIGVFSLLSICFSQALRNPQFHHKYEHDAYETGFSNIKTEIRENIIAENTKLKAEIVWYADYNQAVFKIYGPKKTMKYDAGMYEKAFFETIEKWILEPDHRYYSYNILGRKKFFSRVDKNTDDPIISEEFNVTLLK